MNIKTNVVIIKYESKKDLNVVHQVILNNLNDMIISLDDSATDLHSLKLKLMEALALTENMQSKQYKRSFVK